MISCVQCGEHIPPNALAEGMAFCPHCKHIFPIANIPQPAAAPAPTFTPIDGFSFDVSACEKVLAEMPPPPPSLSADLHPDGLRLVLPWKREATRRGGNLVFLFLVALPAFFYGISEDPGTTDLKVLLGFEAMIGYAWLLTLFNRTVIRLNPRGVAVSHGPLPTYHFKVRRAWQEIRRLSIEKHVRTLRHGTKITTYNLLNGTTDVLTRGWHREDTLEYVKTLIEHTAHTQAQTTPQALTSS